MKLKKKKPEVSINTVAKNIEAISKLEREYLKRQSYAEMFGNMVTRFSSRISIVVLHALWFTVWIAINTGLVKGIKPFDPYPFTFLILVLSLESIFLTLSVLMGQNAQARQTDRWAHLDLQVNLLSEREMTEALKMLRALCKDRQLAIDDREIESMIEHTHVEQLAEALDLGRKL